MSAPDPAGRLRQMVEQAERDAKAETDEAVRWRMSAAIASSDIVRASQERSGTHHDTLAQMHSWYAEKLAAVLREAPEARPPLESEDDDEKS